MAGLRTWLSRFSPRRLFRRRANGGFRIGIYGSPNAGKTSLANAMCRDWTGDVMGEVSEMAHETRRVLTKQEVVLETPEGRLVVDVMDTPGLASRVNPMDFELMYNMPPERAAQRAAEATDGILQAIGALGSLNAMILVIDCADDPYSQVNQVLLAHVQARKLPLLVVANKVDLPSAQPELVQKMFERHPVVAVSAKTGQNLDGFYDALIRNFSN